MRNKNITLSEVKKQADAIGFGIEIREFFSKFDDKDDDWWDRMSNYSIGWWLHEANIPGYDALHRISEEDVERYLVRIYGENSTIPTLDK